MSCQHCQHSHPSGDCPECGCIRFKVRRVDPMNGRDWIVRGEFFIKNRWLKGDARVRAAGPVGAVSKGLREVRAAVVPRRARVLQTKITLIPIKGA